MLDVCDELGVKVIMWSKDTIDWRDKDYEVITKRATKDIQSGDMVLMHPTEQTVKALPHILDYYKEKGLEAVTVSELVANMDTIQFDKYIETFGREVPLRGVNCQTSLALNALRALISTTWSELPKSKISALWI